MGASFLAKSPSMSRNSSYGHQLSDIETERDDNDSEDWETLREEDSFEEQLWIKYGQAQTRTLPMITESPSFDTPIPSALPASYEIQHFEGKTKVCCNDDSDDNSDDDSSEDDTDLWMTYGKKRPGSARPTTEAPTPSIPGSVPAGTVTSLKPLHDNENFSDEDDDSSDDDTDLWMMYGKKRPGSAQPALKGPTSLLPDAVPSMTQAVITKPSIFHPTTATVDGSTTSSDSSDDDDDTDIWLTYGKKRPDVAQSAPVTASVATQVVPTLTISPPSPSRADILRAKRAAAERKLAEAVHSVQPSPPAPMIPVVPHTRTEDADESSDEDESSSYDSEDYDSGSYDSATSVPEEAGVARQIFMQHLSRQAR